MSTTRNDNDLAYAIVEQMGFGFKFRNCSCGQLPCARLQPIVKALAQREAEVRSESKALRAVVEDIANQRLTREIEPVDGTVCGDFEGAYDTMVSIARDAFAAIHRDSTGEEGS